MTDPVDLAAMRERQAFGDNVGNSLGKWAAICNKDRGDLLDEVDRLREALRQRRYAERSDAAHAPGGHTDDLSSK